MKHITILLFLLMLAPLCRAGSSWIVNTSRSDYIRNGHKYYVCIFEITNNGHENLWLWFDERRKKLTNREIAEYFFRKPSSSSAMSLVEQAFDGNVEGPAALFATFIKQIAPNDSFYVNLLSSKPIDESLWLEYIQIHSTTRMFKIKNYFKLLTPSQYPFYQGKAIVINAEISDNFSSYNQLQCKPMHIQDPESYE